MKLLIILGFCLIATSAYRETDTAQRSYGLYNPYYQQYQRYSPYNYDYYYYQPPCYYYGRYPPYNYDYYKYQQYAPYNYEYYNYQHPCYYGKSNYYTPQEYYKPYYYNYKHPYYNPDYYYGDKTRTSGRSSYGHSGHESNYNVPVNYVPGHHQGYKLHSNDHSDLKEVYHKGLAHAAHAALSAPEAKHDVEAK